MLQYNGLTTSLTRVYKRSLVLPGLLVSRDVVNRGINQAMISDASHRRVVVAAASLARLSRLGRINVLPCNE